MTRTPTQSIAISPSSSSCASDEYNHEESVKSQPIDEQIDLTIRPTRRLPSSKTAKQRVISNTITSCLSRSDSPEDVVSVTINCAPAPYLSFYKANGNVSLDDIIDATNFFHIINDPRTNNYRDVLPFLLTSRTTFFKKRLRRLSEAMEALSEEWNIPDVRLSIADEISSFSSLAGGRFKGLSPVSVLRSLSVEIWIHARVNMDTTSLEQLVLNFERMFECCHILLRSRTISKALPKSKFAAAKTALERFLPLSGGVDCFIRFCRHTFPGQDVRYKWVDVV